MSDLKGYLPKIYDGIIEFEELIKIENNLFNDLEKEKEKTINNLYLSTCDIETIKKCENLFNISDSSSNINFRRERLLNRFNMSMPFTLTGLKFKLDEIIGIGNYSVNIDYNNFTIYIESKSINQNWFHETYVTINKMKPANMIFINKPVLTESLFISERLSYSRIEYNYKLGSWRLGQKPFKTSFDEEVIKMEDKKSISESLLNDLRECALNNISYILINNSIKIESFITKSIKKNLLEIEYLIPKNLNIKSVNKVEIFNNNDELKSSIDLYVPFLDDIVLKHLIKIDERG